jgi:hypothetical protein
MRSRVAKPLTSSSLAGTISPQFSQPPLFLNNSQAIEMHQQRRQCSLLPALLSAVAATGSNDLILDQRMSLPSTRYPGSLWLRPQTYISFASCTSQLLRYAFQSLIANVD